MVHVTQPPIELSDLLRLRFGMKANLKARLTWPARHLPAMKCFNTGDITYVDCDLYTDALNRIFGVPETSREVEQITDHYLTRRLSATWWMPTDVKSGSSWWLANNGWTVENILIGMTYQPRTKPRNPIEEIEGLATVTCSTYEQVQDLALLHSSSLATNQPVENAVIKTIYDQAAPALISRAGGLKAIISYVDGVAVTSLLCLVSDGQAGLYDLSTRPGFQEQKYGLATLERALKDVLEAGCEQVTVQASAQTLSIYGELGFVPINQFVMWENRSEI